MLQRKLLFQHWQQLQSNPKKEDGQSLAIIETKHVNISEVFQRWRENVSNSLAFCQLKLMTHCCSFKFKFMWLTLARASDHSVSSASLPATTDHLTGRKVGQQLRRQTPSQRLKQPESNHCKPQLWRTENFREFPNSVFWLFQKTAHPTFYMPNTNHYVPDSTPAWGPLLYLCLHPLFSSLSTAQDNSNILNIAANCMYRDSIKEWMLWHKHKCWKQS